MCESVKVREVIKKTTDIFSRAGIADAADDAFALLFYVKGVDRKDILLDPEMTFTEEESIRYHALAADRARRIPLQHITGRSYFFGREYKVNGNVLIPRFDTELLVEETLKLLKPDDRVLDICTGSGCIIIAIDKGEDNPPDEYNFKSGVATDISGEALNVAKVNAKKHGADNITFLQGDLFEGVSGKFDIIVSNPPYIATDEISGLEPEVRCFDPLIALDGGDDGLVFYKRIIKRAPYFLNRNGHLLLEIGYDQGEAVAGLLRDEGFLQIMIYKDYGGNDRVVSAVRL